MDFQLTEEQKSLKALAREFCKREMPGGPHAAWREIMAKRNAEPADRVPWEWMRKLHKAGLKHLTAPEKYGGGGAGALTAFIVAEELTRLGGAIGIVARQFFSSGEYLAGVASEEQQDEFFAMDMGNPDFIFASAQSEAEAFGDIIWPSDDPKVMKTFAYKDGDEYVINGEKQWCTGGAVADLMVVHARTDKNAPIAQGQSMFFVLPKEMPGVSVVRNNDIFCPHFLPITTLLFENVRVPARNLVGKENKGWGFMWRGVFRQALAPYANDIGEAQALFEYVRDFAKQRIASGKPIIEHGNVGPQIAEMAITIEAARLLCYRGCQRLDHQYNIGDAQGVAGASFVVGTTRAYIIQAMVRVCQLAAEVLAATGATGEAPLEAFLLRTYGFYHAEGTPVFRLFRAAQQIDDFTPTGYE
jgi:alkylation response protein AidB-like acyl-CoA dehydrogenase